MIDEQLKNKSYVINKLPISKHLKLFTITETSYYALHFNMVVKY